MSPIEIIKSYIISFENLIKNRKGPFHLVIKTNDGRYISSDSTFWDYKYQSSLSPKELAFHWDEHDLKPNSIFYNLETYYRIGQKITCCVYLTTAAGDILLTRANFKPGLLK